jgi:two-component system phosphate regulon response regulator PhoB
MSEQRLKQVLMAEDDADTQQLIEVALASKDYMLLFARDGAHALSIARDRRPDIVFLDIVMPHMNGLDVCRALKRDVATKGLMVVMLTALSREQDRVEAAEAGADAYLVKPFSPLKLKAIIHEVLSQECDRRWPMSR